MLDELHATIFLLHAFSNNRNNFVSTYNKKKMDFKSDLHFIQKEIYTKKIANISSSIPTLNLAKTYKNACWHTAETELSRKIGRNNFLLIPCAFINLCKTLRVTSAVLFRTTNQRSISKCHWHQQVYGNTVNTVLSKV